MLKIRVKVETVTGNVVSVVVPLPPSDANSGEDIAGENLNETVEAGSEHDVVVTRVVANPTALDPSEANDSGGEQVSPRAVGEEDEGDAEREEEED